MYERMYTIIGRPIADDRQAWQELLIYMIPSTPPIFDIVPAATYLATTYRYDMVSLLVVMHNLKHQMEKLCWSFFDQRDCRIVGF